MMTSDRPNTEASGSSALPAVATLQSAPTGPQIADLKAEPPASTFESSSQTSGEEKTSQTTFPEPGLSSSKRRKRTLKQSQQPIYNSQQRNREFPAQNTVIIPNSDQLKERWSPTKGANPANNASILTFSNTKHSSRPSSASDPHSDDAAFDDNTPDASHASRGAPRRRLDDGRPYSPALSHDSSDDPRSVPATLSRSSRPSHLTAGLGLSTRYHPYAITSASSSPISPRKQRGRSSRNEDLHANVSTKVHESVLEESSLSPYSPRSDLRGLTPIRQQFANQSLGPNNQQYFSHPTTDQQIRHLPPLHQLASSHFSPRSHYDANESGFLILLNAITPEIVPKKVDIIEQLAGAMSNNMKLEKRHDTYTTFPSMTVPMIQLRDAFNMIAPAALSPFYAPYNLPLPAYPVSQTLALFTGTTDPNHLSEILKWDLHRPTQIHALIALTPCTPQTGMFTLLKGSHGPKRIREVPMSEWEVAAIDLMPGDALIWRGDMNYLLSGGKGGRWALFSYAWAPRPTDIIA